MSRTDSNDELETRVEKLERLAGVKGVLPTTRRQYLSGIGGLTAGALLGKSAVDTATADTHGAGILGSSSDPVAGIYVQEDFGPTMTVDAIDGGVSGLSRVESLSGDSFVRVDSATDPTGANGDVVYYTGGQELYDEGAGEGGWVVGYQVEATLSKETDHLYISATPSGEGSWVTDSTIDLSQYQMLEVHWENTGSSGGESYAVVSNNKTGSATTDVLESTSSVGSFSRTKSVVDVSSIDQSSYIRVHAAGGDGIDAHSDLLTYRVVLI